jgi:hypothetical protein
MTIPRKKFSDAILLMQIASFHEVGIQELALQAGNRMRAGEFNAGFLAFGAAGDGNGGIDHADRVPAIRVERRLSFDHVGFEQNEDEEGQKSDATHQESGASFYAIEKSRHDYFPLTTGFIMP